MSSATAEPPPGPHPGGQHTQSPTLDPQPPDPHSEGDEGGGGGGGEEEERCGKKEQSDPRPPIPGGEDTSHHQHTHQRHLYHQHHYHYPHHHHHSYDHLGGKESPMGLMPTHPPSHHLYAHFQGEGGGDGPAMGSGAGVGSGSVGSPCYGGGEGSTTPPPVRWSQSLQHLLDDQQGIQLFQDYLVKECGTCEPVLFWFACNGLRNNKQQDPHQLVPIIWKKFIRNYSVKVTEITYRTLSERVNNRSIDRNIFDDAQREVAEEIERSTYPSFLKSEDYLTYLRSCTHQGVGADSPHTPQSPSTPGGLSTTGGLPTLHEDCEYEGNTGAPQHLRLTQEALAATAKRRAVSERRKPEAYAGQYLHGRSRYGGSGVSPYHAVYGTAHLSSRQDSELQSLSSGALTDDTISCTDSSVDAISIGNPVNPKYLKMQYKSMRENARQNWELSGGAAGGTGGTFLPRTHRVRTDSMKRSQDPKEFAAVLIDRLEKVKRERESQEKVQESFKRIQEGDNVSDECRRVHAFNSLPPSLLLDKLAQKIQLDDADPSQAILDEHVSRVWKDSNNDTPARSPGSPHAKSPNTSRKGGQAQASRSAVPPQHPSKSGAHPSMFVSGNYPSSGHLGHPHHSLHLPPSHHSAHLPPAHMPHPYQASKNWSHIRHRDRDLYSTFSSDSGNVADYNESNDRPPLHHPLPKSRSMPDYMENYAGISSDGGSSGRRQASGRRASSRRPPADLTDSGVSVVSDSGPSLTPSATSTDRVTSWLLENDKICGNVSTGSVHRETELDPRWPSSRSTHTAAGATSPGMLRRSSCSIGRRSGSGMSIGGTATSGSNTSVGGSSLVGGRSGSQERGSGGWMAGGPEQKDMMGGHPTHGHMIHPSQPHLPHQDDPRRRSRGGGSHGSGRSGGHSSSSGHSRGHSESGSGRGVGHGGDMASIPPPAGSSGSNGSTLRRQRASKHSQPVSTKDKDEKGVACESGGSSSGGSGGGGAGAGAGSIAGSSSTTTGNTDVTTIVYNFHDDNVPFVTRVPTFPVTLKRFKQHLPKKGNFRFFFKKDCKEFGLINEEIMEDSAILPLFEGKIFAQVRKAD